MARIQNRCGETTGIPESSQSSEESSDKGQRRMAELSDGGNGSQSKVSSTRRIL